MDKGKQQGQAESGDAIVMRGHDTKKFRVKVFTGMHEVYGKIFQTAQAERMSKVQIVLAMVITACQIVTMCVQRWMTSLDSTGTGIWSSIMVILAAGAVIWTSKKISYMKLHVSMALHLIASVGTCFLLIFVLCDSIPTVRRRLYYEYITPGNKQYNNYGYRSRYDDGSYHDTTTPTSTPSPAVQYYSSEFGPISIQLVSLAAYAVIAIAGLGQLALSVIMSSMTCRAMCAGRAKMEGKVFAMEIAGREDADAVVVIPSHHTKESNNGNISLPPPYDKILIGGTHPEVSVA